MEKRIQIQGDYLYLPVCTESEEQLLTFWLELPDGTIEKIWEFYVPVPKEQKDQCNYDYFARFPVKQFTDKTLILKGDYPEAFGGEVRTGDLISTVPCGRPSIHFTADSGWINDPNGLVCQHGLYHMYFQYNPCNSKWNNMSWGHAVSRDLLHWKEEDPVLFPDENGMMFSGCGIINDRKLLGLPEDTLLYYYTAAGSSMPWSNGKLFTQRLAYSLDGGKHLLKADVPYLETICKENRDPKIFWHDESEAYIMVLWLQENEFGILRSADLKDWIITERLHLQDAWECPDLVRVRQKEAPDSAKWVFLTADGFYYWGEFDGYTFQTDGRKHLAYFNTVPYAAQTISGISDRTVLIPWIRVNFPGRRYTGAMGVPRELSYEWINGEPVLKLCWIRELGEQKVISETDSVFQKAKVNENQEIDLLLDPEVAHLIEMKFSEDALRTGKTVVWEIAEIKISYDLSSGIFCFGMEEYQVGAKRSEISFLIDDTIFEVTSENGIITGIFELSAVTDGLHLHPHDYESCRIYDITNKMEE